jgi:hypothetical protein
VQRLDGQTSVTNASLISSISATDTTIALKTTTPGLNLASSGFIKLENEVIYYSYITDGFILGGCFRGQNSLAVPHAADTAVYVPQLPSITVWPTPDGSQPYQFVYWRMRRVQDAGGGVNVMDVPFRFVPCMTAGLSYYLALKVPGGMERLQVLKQQYDEAWEIAAGEDQEKAAVRFVPRQMFIG